MTAHAVGGAGIVAGVPVTAPEYPAQGSGPAAPMCGFAVDFRPSEKRVAQMRRITTAYLRLWGLVDVVEDAALGVSELVTNAVRHGRGAPVGLMVRSLRAPHVLRIEVTDGNAAPARLRAADIADESGRGLVLVTALAQDWGVSRSGMTTWCDLALTEGRL